MTFNWKHAGSLASVVELEEFEQKYHVRLGSEHRQFLMTTLNGGAPIVIYLRGVTVSGAVPIPTIGYPGGAADLHGEYGINCPKDYYDMGRALEIYGYLLPDLVPFAYDTSGGEVFVDLVGRYGRLVYVPCDEMVDEPLHPYHVANSISEFLEEASKLADDLFPLA